MKRVGEVRLHEYLEHVDAAIANVAGYVEGMDKAVYLSDRKTQDSVLWNLGVIGEACNNLLKRHPRFISDHPEIPWASAYRMRNALTHGYFAIDHEIVWRTIQDDLPGFRAAVAAARAALADEDRP